MFSVYPAAHLVKNYVGQTRKPTERRTGTPTLPCFMYWVFQYIADLERAPRGASVLTSRVQCGDLTRSSAKAPDDLQARL